MARMRAVPIANDSSESPDPSTDSSAATHTAQSSSDDSASTPVVEHGIKKPARRRGLDVSVPAIVATIALVVFSVFIGVLGPRIGNRQAAAPGTTLLYVAQAFSGRLDERALADFGVTGNARMERGPIEDALREILGQNVALPSSSDWAFRCISVNAGRFAGVSGAILAGRAGTSTFGNLAGIAILKHEQRFIVYDQHSRPIPMPEGEVFVVELSQRQSDAVALIYREDDLVFAVQASSERVAEEIVSALRFATATGKGSGALESPSIESQSAQPRAEN